MQTRPEIHVELPDMLAELAEPVDEQSEDPRPTTNSQSAVSFLGAQLQSQPSAVSDIEHVVVLDLTAPAQPAVAGFEGVLPSSHQPWLDRLMNIMLASIGLLVAAPLMLLVAIA